MRQKRGEEEKMRRVNNSSCESVFVRRRRCGHLQVVLSAKHVFNFGIQPEGIDGTHLQLCASRHHLLEPNTDAFNDCQQHSATNGAISRGLESTSNRQRAASHESCADCVPGIFLLSRAFDGAVESAEEAAPDAEVASQHRGAHLDCCEGTDASLAVRAIAEAFDTVP